MYIGMTNWKRIQSVKQEGYEVEFGKKWELNIFFKKKYIGNFLLKYFFEKIKTTSRLTPST